MKIAKLLAIKDPKMSPFLRKKLGLGPKDPLPTFSHLTPQKEPTKAKENASQSTT